MKQKNKKLEQLKSFYLFVFILGALIIVPTHIFPQPAFMYARFPHYLEMMGPFMEVSWPMTFEIYHYVIYAFIIIGSLNVLGVVYSKFKHVAIASSLVGLLLMSLIVVFFFFVFINVNAATAFIYGIYSMALLIVNILTFKILLRREKEA